MREPYKYLTSWLIVKSMDAVIARIDALSHGAYPGKPAATVYFGGCNLRCPWCFVPNMVSRVQCVHMSMAEILEELAQSDIAEAVVFDGGEPLMQSQAVEFLCSALIPKGLETKIQTNGTQPGTLGHLLSKQLLTRVSIDVKAPLDNQRVYQKMCGVRSEKIAGDVAKSLSVCHAFKTPLDVTVPIVPLFNDKPRLIRTIARQVAPYAESITLIEFDNRVTMDPELESNPPPSRDQLHLLAKECKPYINNTRIRTRLYGEEAI